MSRIKGSKNKTPSKDNLYKALEGQTANIEALDTKAIPPSFGRI